MIWNLWKKNRTDAVKMSRPKELESRIGRMLVVDLNYEPDWVWRLRSVTKKRNGSNSGFNFRIFDPDLAQMKGINIVNFSSLDAHPKMIYFDGWYDKAAWEITINDKYKHIKSIPAA
ncbi:MAG: hypothetical protein D3926_01115 [Desulfobacteraceae bacterium]|nr:MAG: hypothetical protein D3926_01115 [Desulfobacteraceae bacterium]